MLVSDMLTTEYVRQGFRETDKGYSRNECGLPDEACNVMLNSKSISNVDRRRVNDVVLVETVVQDV